MDRPASNVEEILGVPLLTPLLLGAAVLAFAKGEDLDRDLQTALRPFDDLAHQ